MRKSICAAIGIEADTEDQDVLAKAAAVAGVAAPLLEARSGGLPGPARVANWMQRHAPIDGVIEWGVDGIADLHKVQWPATTLAELWDKILKRPSVWNYRFGVPLETIAEVPAVSGEVLRQLTSEPLRPSGLSVLDKAGEWKGRWNWPVCFGVLPDASGLKFAQALENIDMVKRGLAKISRW